MITFFGVMDLFRRNQYIALLEHSSEKFQVGYDDIWKSVQDGMQYPDLRWTLPFILPQLIHDMQRARRRVYSSGIRTLRHSP